MKVFYSRVSTSDGSQKHDRQLTDVKGFDYVFSDSCSGSIDLFDRPKGSQIIHFVTVTKMKMGLNTVILRWRQQKMMS